MFSFFEFILLCVVFGIILLALILQKNQNRKKGVQIESYQYLAVDIIVLVLISLVCMLVLIPLIEYDFPIEWLKNLADSGILLATSLFVIGKLVHLFYSSFAIICDKIYSYWARKLKLTISPESVKDNSIFSRFDEIKSVSFLFSATLFCLILFSVGECRAALTMISIIIGRFVWFDTIGHKIGKDVSKLFEVLRTIPYATFISLFLIVISIAFGDGRIAVIIAFGIVLAFISFVIYVDFLSKKQVVEESNE